MTHTYNITGLTCNGCVAKAKSTLLKFGDITSADIQLAAPQATITMQKHIPVTALQEALGKVSHYTITEADGGMHKAMAAEENTLWLATYKPILIIGAYITMTTFLIEAASGSFVWENWMQNFMAGFFLVFSFLKLIIHLTPNKLLTESSYAALDNL